MVGDVAHCRGAVWGDGNNSSSEEEGRCGGAVAQSLDNSTDVNTSAALGNNATTVIYTGVAGVINSENTSPTL